MEETSDVNNETRPIKKKKTRTKKINLKKLSYKIRVLYNFKL